MARRSLLNNRSNGPCRTRNTNNHLRISGRSGDIKVHGRAMNVNTGINVKEEVSIMSYHLTRFTKYSPLHLDRLKRISRYYYNHPDR
jgi:hypothetical protein